MRTANARHCRYGCARTVGRSARARRGRNPPGRHLAGARGGWGVRFVRRSTSKYAGGCWARKEQSACARDGRAERRRAAAQTAANARGAALTAGDTAGEGRRGADLEEGHVKHAQHARVARDESGRNAHREEERAPVETAALSHPSRDLRDAERRERPRRALRRVRQMHLRQRRLDLHHARRARRGVRGGRPGECEHARGERGERARLRGLAGLQVRQRVQERQPYGVRDAACPLSTRGGTRLVRLVRGRGNGGGGGISTSLLEVEHLRPGVGVCPHAPREERLGIHAVQPRHLRARARERRMRSMGVIRARRRGRGVGGTG